MPIDTDAFEHGDHRDSVEREILAFLQENPEKAYNAQEITNTVMDVGISERNVDRPSDFRSFMAEFVDIVTVCTILDGLIDNGVVERRIVDAGEGPRSYYRTRAE